VVDVNPEAALPASLPGGRKRSWKYYRIRISNSMPQADALISKGLSADWIGR
jgi:hypothetical protein